MNGLAYALFGLTLVLAVLDWAAVHTANQRAEWVLKPATMLPLIGAALALDPADPTIRAWFVVGLVFSLTGDVLLMLPSDRFVFGLGSFLIGHLAYIAGLANADLDASASAVGAVLVLAALIGLAPRIVRGAAATDSALAAPVAAYIGVISAMAVLAIGSTVAAAIVGAGLFFVSDAIIGWTRFVAEHHRSRVVIMSTYHLAQVLLVVALLDIA